MLIAPPEEDEILLVVPAADIAGKAPGGLLKLATKGSRVVFPFDVGRVCTGRRKLLEADPYYRQLVAYVVVRATDPQSKQPVYLAYRRKGGEERLAGRISIGFGGHVNADDLGDNAKLAGTLKDAIVRAGEREVIEELADCLPMRLSHPLAMILDDSDEVGRVHVGALMFAGGSIDRMPTPADDSTEILGWYTAPELAAMGDDLESWSRIVVGGLEGGGNENQDHRIDQ